MQRLPERQHLLDVPGEEGHRVAGGGGRLVLAAAVAERDRRDDHDRGGAGPPPDERGRAQACHCGGRARGEAAQPEGQGTPPHLAAGGGQPGADGDAVAGRRRGQEHRRHLRAGRHTHPDSRERQVHSDGVGRCVGRGIQRNCRGDRDGGRHAGGRGAGDCEQVARRLEGEAGRLQGQVRPRAWRHRRQHHGGRGLAGAVAGGRRQGRPCGRGLVQYGCTIFLKKRKSDRGGARDIARLRVSRKSQCYHLSVATSTRRVGRGGAESAAVPGALPAAASYAATPYQAAPGMRARRGRPVGGICQVSRRSAGDRTRHRASSTENSGLTPRKSVTRSLCVCAFQAVLYQ
mmetsp:Transcript_33093/g.84532  ORF Transcript_33093/g.84532 Transcript_33093/m.84532 type:complete len:346 (+) Transcript_33093:710-1747(+)